jgi:hypothetical protein
MHRNHFFIVHDSTNIIHLRYVEYDLEKDLKYTTKELKRIRASHCAFCTLGCGLWFGLQSFLFSSRVPLPCVIYLIII